MLAKLSYACSQVFKVEQGGDAGCCAGGSEARDRPSYGNSKLPQQGNGAAHIPHQSAPDLQNDFPSLG